MEDNPTQRSWLGNGLDQACPTCCSGEISKTVVSATSGEWSEEQELALVKALKVFGRDVEDRWDRISEAVPGKSKAQCFRRFKELRETFRAKKSGGDQGS